MQLKGTYIKDNEETEINILYNFYDIIKILIYIIIVLYIYFISLSIILKDIKK